MRTDQDFGDAESPAYWREHEMLLLQQVMALVGKNLSPLPALREMLHLMSELLGLNRGRIVLSDENRQFCRIRHAYGLTRNEIERGCYAFGEGITGRVIQNGQLAIVQDIDQEPSFLARAVERSKLPPGPVAFIALPISIDRVTVGVLACHRIRRRSRAIADDLTLLRILATLVGQLLQLETRLQEKTQALEQQNAALARALESATARYGIIGTSPRLSPSSNGYRIRPRACCCSESRGPARSFSRVRCILQARDVTRHSSRSTARPYPMRCSNRNCSAMNAAHSPVRPPCAPDGSSKRMREPSFSMKSVSYR